MNTQVTTFENSKLPSFLQKSKKVANAFAAAVGGGDKYKFLSIKSKVFTIVDGESKELVTQPGADGAPASYIEVVIVGTNPNKSKVYYAGGYTEGSTEKPLCYSNNGISPEADAQDPQATKCATCAQNVWGGKITEAGKKAKACSDSMRLAVARPDRLNDPMLLRVPAASLVALGKYGHTLQLRDVEPGQVVTRIKFDYSVAYPALEFKAVDFVSEEQNAEITEMAETDLVKQVTGVMAAPERTERDEPFEPRAEARVEPKVEAKTPAPRTPAPVAAKPEAPKPVTKPKPAPVVAAEDDDLPPIAAKAKVKVEQDMADEVGELVTSADDLDFDD